MDTAAPADPAESAASRAPVTYCSTAVQTRPPPNGTVFSLIHGRKPTMHDVECNMGLAGMGRFKGPNDVLHGVVFDEAFEREPNEYESTTTDSGFQTLDPTSRQKAVTKAKAKASMIASKYKSVAAKARCKFFGETKDDKVVHTERIACSIQLDAEGIAKGDEDLTGRFLPNIYRGDIKSEDNPRSLPSAPVSRTPASYAPQKTSPISAPQHIVQPPFAPSQSTATADTQLPCQVPALEPSSPEGREYTDAAGVACEYRSYSYDQFGYIAEVAGPHAVDCDDEFVVLGPNKSPPRPRKSNDSSLFETPLTTQSDIPPADGTRKRKKSSQVNLPPPAKNNTSSQGVRRKRRDTSHIDEEEPLHRPKRARTSSPPPEVSKSQDKPHSHKKRDEQYTKRRERSSSRPAQTSRVVSPYKREDRKAALKHEHSTYPVQTSRATSTDDRKQRGTSREHEDVPRRSRRDETRVSRRRSNSRFDEDSRRSRRASVSRDGDDTRKSRGHSRSPIGSAEEGIKPSRNRHDTHTDRRRSRSPMTNDQEADRPSRDRKNTRTTRRRSRSPARDSEEADRLTRNRNDTRITRYRSRSPVRSVEKANSSARSDRRENEPAPREEDLGQQISRAQTPRDSVPATPTFKHAPVTATTPATPTGPRKDNITDVALAEQIEQNKRDVKTKIAERRAKRGERAPLKAYVPPARRR
jgi:hypothetical protein